MLAKSGRHPYVYLFSQLTKRTLPTLNTFMPSEFRVWRMAAQTQFFLLQVKRKSSAKQKHIHAYAPVVVHTERARASANSAHLSRTNKPLSAQISERYSVVKAAPTFCYVPTCACIPRQGRRRLCLGTRSSTNAERPPTSQTQNLNSHRFSRYTDTRVILQTTRHYYFGKRLFSTSRYTEAANLQRYFHLLRTGCESALC